MLLAVNIASSEFELGSLNSPKPRYEVTKSVLPAWTRTHSKSYLASDHFISGTLTADIASFMEAAYSVWYRNASYECSQSITTSHPEPPRHHSPVAMHCQDAFSLPFPSFSLFFIKPRECPHPQRCPLVMDPIQSSSPCRALERRLWMLQSQEPG